MLILLAVPVFLAVAAIHRLVTIYAPTNILLRHVRLASPRLRTTVGMAALTVGLISAAHLVELSISVGAPTWLYFVVAAFAWDAIKVGLSGILMAVTCAISWCADCLAHRSN